MPVWHFFKETVEPILAFVAILFAVWQYKDSRELKKQSEGIVKSMTTRYIGMFPDNFKELNELLSEAHRSLDILLDYAGYGHYGDPEFFKTYLSNIRNAKPGVRRRMILYSSALTLAIFNTREFTEEVWNDMRKTNKYHSFFRDGSCPSTSEEPATVEEFRDLMFRNLAIFLFELQISGVEIRSVDAEQPVFLWKADDLDSVVSFRSQHADDSEAVFRTRDSRLLESLDTLFELAWEHATVLPRFPAPPSEWGGPAATHLPLSHFQKPT